MHMYNLLAIGRASVFVMPCWHPLQKNVFFVTFDDINDQSIPSGAWPCTLKSDEEKWTYAGLAHEHGFSISRVHLLEESVINMIWTMLPDFDWSSWFAISSSHLFTVIVFSFMGAVAKK
jgi:hypothetical protein